MKTLIRILPFLLLCCNITYGQSLQNQISSYNTGVNSSITNSNTHSQQITQTIVGNAFTNLSGIVNNVYDSLLTRDSLSTIRVSSIADLESYSGFVDLILVTDSLRGGWFNKVTTGTPDSGICFPAADGNYWKRVYSGDILATWYGAIGDSATDNTAALNNWLASPYLKGNYGRVPKGDFLVSDSLLVAQQCRIVGSAGYAPNDLANTNHKFVGGSSVIIQTANKPLFHITAKGVYLDGLTMKNTDSTSMSAGVIADSGYAMQIRNCYFGDFYDELNVGGATEMTVASNHFSGTRHRYINWGSDLGDGGDNIIQSNWFGNSLSADTGVYVTGVAGFRFFDNKAYGGTDTSEYTSVFLYLKAITTTSDISVCRNSIEAYKNSAIIVATDSTHQLTKVLIANNNTTNGMHQNMHHFVVTTPITGAITNVVVTDNVIQNTGTWASIILNGINGYVIENNGTSAPVNFTVSDSEINCTNRIAKTLTQILTQVTNQGDTTTHPIFIPYDPIYDGSTHLGLLQIKNPQGASFNKFGAFTGAIKLQLPVIAPSAHNIMEFDITVSGLATPIFQQHIQISSYFVGSSQTWNSPTQIISSSGAIIPVRVAYDGTNPSIIIGDTTTVWDYASASVDDINASFGSLATLKLLGSGWSSSLITSWNGLTVTNPVTISTPGVTSVTPGFGFTNNMPITSAGTLTIDTTKVASINAINSANTVSFSTISAMEGYTGAATKAIVTDPNRGGVFYYTNSILISDTGTIFHAIGIGSGYWVRVYKRNSVLVNWFKDSSDYDDTKSFHRAFTYFNSIEGNPKSTYIVSQPIYLNTNQLFDGHFCTIKRANVSLSTTLSVSAANQNYIVVSNPNIFHTGDEIVLVNGIAYNQNSITGSSVPIINSISNDTLHLSSGIALAADGSTPSGWPIGSNVIRTNEIFVAPTTVNNISIKNTIFNGNSGSNNYTYFWFLNITSNALATNITYDKCTFDSTPCENIVAAGPALITNCNYHNLNGSFVHGANNLDSTKYDITIMNCIGDTSNIITTATSDHSEGIVTISQGVKNLTISHCNFKDAITAAFVAPIHTETSTNTSSANFMFDHNWIQRCANQTYLVQNGGGNFYNIDISTNHFIDIQGFTIYTVPTNTWAPQTPINVSFYNKFIGNTFLNTKVTLLGVNDLDFSDNTIQELDTFSGFPIDNLYSLFALSRIGGRNLHIHHNTLQGRTTNDVNSNLGLMVDNYGNNADTSTTTPNANWCQNIEIDHNTITKERWGINTSSAISSTQSFSTYFKGYEIDHNTINVPPNSSNYGIMTSPGVTADDNTIEMNGSGYGIYAFGVSNANASTLRSTSILYNNINGTGGSIFYGIGTSNNCNVNVIGNISNTAPLFNNSSGALNVYYSNNRHSGFNGMWADTIGTFDTNNFIIVSNGVPSAIFYQNGNSAQNGNDTAKEFYGTGSYVTGGDTANNFYGTSQHITGYDTVQNLNISSLSGGSNILYTNSNANVAGTGNGSSGQLLEDVSGVPTWVTLLPTRYVTTNTTAGNSDGLIQADCTAGNVTITLSNIVTTGKIIIVKMVSGAGNTVTITSPTTIDGNNGDTVLTQVNQSIMFLFDGAKYNVIASHDAFPVYGTSTQSGNGATTTFTIAHGLGITPTWFNVLPTSAAAGNISYITADATNITVHYSTAPTSGTNNLTYNFEARP